MEKTDVLLETQGLKKYFESRKFPKRTAVLKAVDNVSIKIRRHETMGLVGESGCGKSTLGRAILKLHEPTDGKIIFDGCEIQNYKFKQMRQIRRKMQMIFQDPFASLNPRKTVMYSVKAPLDVAGIGSEAEREEKVYELLNYVGLNPSFAQKFPHEMSGGQRQRVVIARAMIIDPEFVVCDEPVSALDVSIQAQILNLMKDLQQEKNLTYVFIAHDLSVVEFMSDWVAVMYLGRVVEYARASELYRRPSHPYTQALLSAVPIPDVDVKKDQIILEGDVPSPAHPPKGCRFHPRCWKCQERCKCEDPALSELKDAQGHCVACFYPD